MQMAREMVPNPYRAGQSLTSFLVSNHFFLCGLTLLFITYYVGLSFRESLHIDAEFSLSSLL